jgi:hypothetical protein
MGMVATLGVLTGCATSFTGSAKVDGPKECREVCDKWGMDLAGMVAMGEYTNGCICRVKGERLSLNSVADAMLLSSAGSTGGAAAVYMQNQED